MQQNYYKCGVPEQKAGERKPRGRKAVVEVAKPMTDADCKQQ
jgi:hypothetical protein